MSKLSSSAIFIFCTFQLIMGLQQGLGQNLDLNAKCEFLEVLGIPSGNFL